MVHCFIKFNMIHLGHRPFSQEQSSYLRFAGATALWRLKILFCRSRTTLIIKQNFKVLLNFEVYSMYYTNSGFHKVLIEDQTYPSPSHIGFFIFKALETRKVLLSTKSIYIHLQEIFLGFYPHRIQVFHSSSLCFSKHFILF